MKKYTIVWIILLLFASTGQAKKRSQNEAQAVAESFLEAQSVSLRSAPGESPFTLAYTCYGDDASLRSRATDAYFYVFNINDDRGFIIISGDDRSDDILGYSLEGSFDINSLPPNFRNWLTYYSDELGNLTDDLPESEDAEIPQGITQYASEIAPLLGKMAWGQREPFNNLCPIIPKTENVRSIAGCVATAMAQIMKYYEWPVKGKGVKSYITETHRIRLSVDFSKTTYDWANMTDVYNEQSTQDERDAVATLVYHCGVASEMNYSYESGTNQLRAAFGLKDNFGYNPYMQLLERRYYTTTEWYNILKEELNASRPILYVGANESRMAHAFVCDGYDRNGLFHFNWGWTGSNDGYFNVSVIKSSNMATYNGDQNIIAGIQPANTSMSATQTLIFSDVDSLIHIPVQSIERNEGIDFLMNIYHTCVTPFSGEIGIGLYRGDELYSVIYRESIKNMTNNKNYLVTDTVYFPDTIEEGSYLMRPVFSIDGTEWQQVRSILLKALNTTVAVNSTTVSFAWTRDYPELILNSLKSTSTFYANHSSGKAEATFINNGKDDIYTSLTFLIFPYNVPVEAYLNGEITTRFYQTDLKYLYVPKGESLTIQYNPKITLSSGTYNLYVIENQSHRYLNRNSPLRMTIQPEPQLELTQKISFPDTRPYDGDTLTIMIKNTGADFAGYVFTDVVDAETKQVIFSLNPAPINIRKSETVKLRPVFIEKSVIPSGSYMLGVSYAPKASDNVIVFGFTPEERIYSDIFTVESPDANTPSTTTFEVYPNPATHTLYVRSDAGIKSVSIFDISGRQAFSSRPEKKDPVAVAIGHFPSGIYILRCETAAGTFTTKFIKR